MKRRSVLALAGGAITSAAGCLGGSGGPTGPTNDESLPPDRAPGDGYPPAFDPTPTPRTVDPDSFETISVRGVDVPLAPIDDVYYWYARRDARFADARGPSSYAASHIFGAVLSPAPDGLQDDDPVTEWPTTDRIVCYCGCPHHLSSLRAAALRSSGYENVYVIDEGFWEWQDRGYPMAGGDVDRRPSRRVIEGVTAPRFAGGTAWARHPASGQREAAPIGDDGGYRLELRFADVTEESVVAVETPGYRVTGTLGELTGRLVTGDARVPAGSGRSRSLYSPPDPS